MLKLKLHTIAAHEDVKCRWTSRHLVCGFTPESAKSWWEIIRPVFKKPILPFFSPGSSLSGDAIMMQLLFEGGLLDRIIARK